MTTVSISGCQEASMDRDIRITVPEGGKVTIAVELPMPTTRPTGIAHKGTERVAWYGSVTPGSAIDLDGAAIAWLGRLPEDPELAVLTGQVKRAREANPPADGGAR